LVLSLGVKIFLRSAVTFVDPKKGAQSFLKTNLRSSQSRARKYIAINNIEPHPFGVSIFRLLIPSSTITQDLLARKIIEKAGETSPYISLKALIVQPPISNQLFPPLPHDIPAWPTPFRFASCGRPKTIFTRIYVNVDSGGGLTTNWLMEIHHVPRTRSLAMPLGGSVPQTVSGGFHLAPFRQESGCCACDVGLG